MRELYEEWPSPDPHVPDSIFGQCMIAREVTSKINQLRMKDGDPALKGFFIAILRF
jgi:hypothetical protein